MSNKIYTSAEQFFEELKRKRQSYGWVKRKLTEKAPRNHSYNWWYYLKKPHKYLLESKNNRNARRQRGQRGWADRDTWSLDLYILKWLPDALDYLADNAHAWPGEGYEDFSTPEEWEQLLHKMATGFREGRNWHVGFEGKSPPQEFEEAFDLFRKYFWHLWD